MENPSIARLREEYAAVGLSADGAGDDPVLLFEQWLDEAVASGMHEPNAMVLATASADGAPSARTVLLKAFGADGAVFYTNYESRKGRDLEANPLAALVMTWHPLHRQVRIEGSVSHVRSYESDDYFASRPRGSRLGAVASPQSKVVGSRAELDARYEGAAAEYPEYVPRPAHWGGYRVGLDLVEFWQGRTNRMHDRIRFVRTADGWCKERLAP